MAIKELLLDVAKTGLRHLNFHKSGGRADIALVGSRRSGSTLLMQMIGSSHGVRSVNQPLSIQSGPFIQARKVAMFRSRYFTNLSESERLAMRKFFEDIRKSQIRVDEPWRLWAADFHFRTNRIVFKFTNAHYLRSLLKDDLGMTVVDFLRHPLHQVISCERNKWAHHLDDFVREPGFLEQVLSPDERSCLDDVSLSGSPFEKLALTWILENLPILRSTEAGYRRVYYEDLVAADEAYLNDLCTALQIEVRAASRELARPSRSTKSLSTQVTKDSISKRNLLNFLQEKHQKIPEEKKEVLQTLLDTFRIETYSAYTVFPCHDPRGSV